MSHDARTENQLEAADRERTERKDREWEEQASNTRAERLTPETDRIMENFHIAMHADTREQAIAHAEEVHREVERLERERDDYKEAMGIAGRSADDQMWQKREAERQLADARALLENTIAERDQLRRDYNESREKHWQTLELLKMAQDQRDALRGMLDAQEARHRLAMEEITKQRDALAAAIGKIRDNAIAIQKIRYGYDGDGGAFRLADFIEEDCDRVLAAVKGGKE